MGIIKASKLVFDYVTKDEEEHVEDVNRAIDDVNLDIKAGSFVAVLGHNGSGKSTFAKTMNGILLPTEGTVWISGMNTADDDSLWKVRKTVGMVFQNPDNQIIGNVVEEDVGFGPENLGVPTDEIWQRVDRSLNAVGMTAYRLKSPNKLSGGQKQRVAIAGVMAMKPQCIVLDEPTAMLDPNGRKDVIRTVTELNRQEHITIVLITHYMEEVIHADRVIVMDDGRIAMDGTPAEVFSHVKELKELRLDLPQVTELAYELKTAGVKLPDGILTIDELMKPLLPLLKSGAGKQAAHTDAAPGQEDTGKRRELIRVDKVSFVYGKGTAFEQYGLKNVSFTVPEGQFLGIIGHTGSGKSTLIQHLDGLLKASSGKIYYDGKDIYAPDYDMRSLRFRVGLVFQYPEHQLFEETVFADVCYGPKNEGLSAEEAEARAKEALTTVGLDESFYKQSPFELSGGQKRRVAIAGVLAMKPEVLILDEPTAGLDPRGRDEILDNVSALQKQQGITVILVSHSMEDIAKYVDRIIVMNAGEKAFDDTPRNVFRHYKELEEMGLSAPQVTYIAHRISESGIPIDCDITTVEEAKRAVLSLIKR